MRLASLATCRRVTVNFGYKIGSIATRSVRNVPSESIQCDHRALAAVSGRTMLVFFSFVLLKDTFKFSFHEAPLGVTPVQRLVKLIQDE